ncbi:MAG: triacylglycerol lipase [Lachnospiraceae bacterium]|nr:triacylglycerol lipase [Lachnospiraceae bacterium]
MNDKRTEKPITKARLAVLAFGSFLLTAFLLIALVAGIILIRSIAANGFIQAFKDGWGWILLTIVAEVIIFWAGIIMVYLTSVQLGIKMRIIGIICGWIPIVHLVVLLMILSTTWSEYFFESSKMRLDKKRASEQICATKYPILMVHGVFFRDFKYFNYWGRIPKELETNGARIFYGNHQSAAAVENSAQEIADRIHAIVEETGCEKVNVIAHSKGGLDTKTAIALKGMAPYVASLTTINTPHMGCEFAEYLLGKAPQGLKDKVSGAYNAALKKAGDENPSFMDAVTDLTAGKCKSLTEKLSAFDYQGAGVYTQSYGSCMKKATSGAFPLNMSYLLAKYFDGPNDGLVGAGSFKWGENYTYLENTKSNRGISHGDMIDLNRENIKGFDVREFYVQLVADLKKRGL